MGVNPLFSQAILQSQLEQVNPFFQTPLADRRCRGSVLIVLVAPFGPRLLDINPSQQATQNRPAVHHANVGSGRRGQNIHRRALADQIIIVEAEQ